MLRAPLGVLLLCLVLATTGAQAAFAGARGGPRISRSAVDLSALCVGGNCDAAFASMRAGGSYYLPAGVWTFTKPFSVSSGVILTGDGTGLFQGTDLVYTGPTIPGAVVTAGAPGGDWTNGHIAALEIETDQLHQWRLAGGSSTDLTIDQAGIGLEIVNPTASSTVDGVSIQTFGVSSVRIDNHAASPGSGVFQLSQFFLGGSPRSLEVEGSRTALLLRFGGIDFGPSSELAMRFAGDATGATAVVESVKIEGNNDLPGVLVTGSAPVVLVGSTRVLFESLYTDTPRNSAPSLVYSNPSRPQTDVLQCLSCTMLGEQTALALKDLLQGVPTSKWGIILGLMTSTGAAAVTRALGTPETPTTRPHKIVNLAPLCVGGNCDAPFAGLEWGGRYYLPAGVWTFSRPFTIPSSATFFGDGPQTGGTVLLYTGPAVMGGAAVNFGDGGDLSGARFFSLRIVSQQPLTGGFGMRVVNATNASTLEDVSIAGFPDGQLLIDDGGTSGPGPNFFRLARFALQGGVHPLMVVGGRVNFLAEQGTVSLDATSKEGVYLLNGEWSGVTRVVESVTVTGNYDVPGFTVDSNAANLFVKSSRTSSGQILTSPAFLYSSTQWPRAVTQCLSCVTSGVQTAFAMPALGISVTARDGKPFSYLNPNATLSPIAPF